MATAATSPPCDQHRPPAVGSWAERNNVVYGLHQELAGHPLVYDMIQQNIEETNRSLAEDKVTAGAQVKRFLILHRNSTPTTAR